MRELIGKWRRDAAFIRGNLSKSAVAKTLDLCADQLEESWHRLTHNAEYAPDCPLCEQEQSATLERIREVQENTGPEDPGEPGKPYEAVVHNLGQFRDTGA